jgi:hypothetical protein
MKPRVFAVAAVIAEYPKRVGWHCDIKLNIGWLLSWGYVPFGNSYAVDSYQSLIVTADYSVTLDADDTLD